MFEMQEIEATEKPAFYAALLKQASALVAGEADRVANAANLTALLFHTLPDVIWVGFYFFDGNELVVGPFQGKPACVRIALGRGACGAAAQRREVVMIDDVNQLDDHIVCDADSRSEIVVPVQTAAGALLGVLDIDSARVGRFDRNDAEGLQPLASLIAQG